MNVIRQILIVFGICLLATVVSGLLEHLDLLTSSGAALAAVCLVSGFFTFAAAALTVRLVQRIQKGGRREGTDL